METWEYLTFLATGPELERKLPQLGEDGWELVSFVPTTYEATGSGNVVQQTRWRWWLQVVMNKWSVTQYRAVFKRRTPSA